MARNKHPEETVKLILDTAAELFIKNGYDETSLQDIMDVTKLSKGAIYHHFASKEEIFIRIVNQLGERNERILGRVRDDGTLNGREKLKKLFRTALLVLDQQKAITMIPYLLDSPRFLALQIRNLYDEVVPFYIEPILKEGVADGSIQTDHPQALAEAIMILSNVWLHPMLMPTSPEAVRSRCEVFNQLLKGMGIGDLLDEELTDAYVSYSVLINRHEAQE